MMFWRASYTSFIGGSTYIHSKCLKSRILDFRHFEWIYGFDGLQPKITCYFGGLLSLRMVLEKSPGGPLKLMAHRIKKLSEPIFSILCTCVLGRGSS